MRLGVGWLLMLGSSATAADLPARPTPPEPVSGECARVMPLTAGESLPTWLLKDDQNTPCSAVVVPLSDYSDLLATEAWAKAIESRYQIDTASLEFKIGWYQGELQRAREPLPFFYRPGTLIVVGSMVGATSVLLSAYAVRAVATVEVPQ